MARQYLFTLEELALALERNHVSGSLADTFGVGTYDELARELIKGTPEEEANDWYGADE